jgi:hypothetical protein
MKKVLIGLVVVGLVLGFGYLSYCVFLSGSPAGQFPIFTQDVKSVGVGGFEAATAENAKWETPVTVHLTPDMNPIAFNIASETARARRTRKEARYQTRLSLGQKLIWEKDLRLVKKRETGKGKKKTISIGGLSHSSTGLKTFSVTEAGDYQFDVEAKGGDLLVAELTLKVQKHVVVPNKAIFIPGFAVFVIGVVGLVLQTKKRAHPTPVANQ